MSGQGNETPDQAQTRRRWITLAEVVAVAGVVIAALTLYNNWQDRRTAAADKAIEQASAARDRAGFVLHGTPSGDGRDIVFAKTDAHPLGDVRVTFPAALGVSPQDAVDQRIAGDWFDAGLRKATDGGPDAQDGRLPVLIRYTYLTGETPTTRQAIYDVVWRTHGRIGRGRKVELLDLRLREPGGNTKRLDALWLRNRPAA